MSMKDTNMSQNELSDDGPTIWHAASNPETLTEKEILEVLERGGPFFTIEFVSADGMFVQKRILGYDEAQDVLAGLGEELAKAKVKYNIDHSEETK